MKSKHINLHMERKRALAIMLFFALLLSLIGVFATITVKTDCAEINSLLRSSYIYSAYFANPVFQDDYYQFDAGISFMLSVDAQKSINAEILMQSADSKYTESVAWNTDILGLYGIALTDGLARANKLQVGDKLYSKHIVDGTVHEYDIEKILPEVTSARITNGGDYNSGIIIMGYDSRYIDNITHECILFTNDSVNDFSTRISGTPEKILYRSDEIYTVVKKLLPYFLLFTLLFIMLVSILVRIIMRTVKCNFRRLVIHGFEKKDLNSAYNVLIGRVGVMAILIAACITAGVSQLFVFSLVEALVLLALVCVELATLFVSTGLSKRQLWR